MDVIPSDLVYFAAIWIVSTFALHISARLLGAKGGLFSSFVASFLGAAIYSFFRGSLVFQIAAMILWFLVLRFSFQVGWFRAAVISVVASFFVAVVSLILGVPLMV